jgi:hypothetical protein
MQDEPIIREVNRPFIVRMSGDYEPPQEGFMRKHIAMNRLYKIIPDYLDLSAHDKRRARTRLGIVVCHRCKYPQKIENKVCCFCNENVR